MSQFFSTLPLCNVFNKNPHRIEFKWISITAFFGMSLIFFGSIEVWLAALSLKDVSLNLNNIGKSLRRKYNNWCIIFLLSGLLVFFGVTLAEAMVLFKFATKWKYFIDLWTEKEDIFLREPYKIIGWKLKFKVNLAIYSLIGFAMGKYL